MEMMALELCSYKRPYSALSYEPDFSYGFVQKRYQSESFTSTETIDLSALTKEALPIKSFAEQGTTANKAQLMEKYMLNLLKDSDQIAKRMMFHDLIYFRLGRGERPDFIMKEP